MIRDKDQSQDFSQHISEHDPDARKQFHAKFSRVLTASGARSDSELARILEIKPSSVGAAKRRMQLPPGWVEQIAQKFEINADWLFFGTGPMRRGEAAAPAPQPAPPSADAFLTAPQEEFRMSDMVTKTIEVLESDTIYRTALASNINAFHQAVKSERTLARIEERMADLEAKSESMSKELGELRRENRELKLRLEPIGQEKAVG